MSVNIALYDRPRGWDPTVALLERLIGPVRSEPGPATAFEVLVGRYEGHVVRAVFLGRVRTDRLEGSSLRLSMSLGERPIETYVWSRSGSSIWGPTVVTADEAFDRRYIAKAQPQEVVSAAFDADVRAMIDRRWDGKDTSILAEQGWVGMHAAGTKPGRPSEIPTPDEAELRQLLDDLALLTTRLREAYDGRRSEIVASEGEEAARTWDEENRTASEKALVRRRVIIVGALVLVLLPTVLFLVGLFVWVLV